MNAVVKPITDTNVIVNSWNGLAASLEELRGSSVDVRSLSKRSALVPPIVIVGAGPAAQECAHRIGEKMSGNDWLLMLNGEQYLPYHRAQLSAVLASRHRIDSLLAPGFPTTVKLVHDVNIAVVDAQGKKIFTDSAVEFHYKKLVLATGSRSRRPPIAGLSGSRVFDFRQLQDLEKIAALAPSNVAVLGGGLLGIEAARALRRFCNKVTVFERFPHLLPRQMDLGAGERLTRHLQARGIQVEVNARLVSAQPGGGQVMLIDEGQVIHSFDAVVCATGIEANTELAAQAQLKVNNGIVVDDQQRTSDPDIYAIGECSERDGQVAGNLSAVLEHARRAAHAILDQSLPQQKMADVFQLKMGSCVAVAIGNVQLRDSAPMVFVPNERSYYRVIVDHQRVVGAILVGDAGFDFSPFTAAVEHGLLFSEEVEKEFLKTGQLPCADSPSPETVICFCTGVNYGQLCELRNANLNHAEITAKTGASLHCGSCAQRVACITSGDQASSHVVKPKGMWTAIALSLLLIAAMIAAVAIPFAQSWQSRWRLIDVLWRDNTIRQITGYTFFTLMLLAFVPAWRRRSQRETKRQQSLSFMSWHLILMCAVIVAFVFHTGARMGYGLNASLSWIFVATLMLGGVASVAWRQASRSPQHRTASSYLRAAHWALLFPLPVMLVFHVVKIYYF